MSGSSNNRYLEISFLIFVLASMACTCSAIFLRKNDDEDSPSLLPRTLTIFSRPDPHADKNKAPGLIPHLGSVLHGGSIGIEIKPFGFISGILGHAKKVIPGSKDTVGHPSHEKPPPEKDNYDERDWELEKPKKEPHKEWVPEEEKPGKDKKPDKPVGPSWDDIGENPEEDEGYNTEVPIEDIIQPRLRPKRFIESKIYHVPLLYRSNARPFQVKIKSRNDLDESKVERN